jgi:hypothetical protein
VFSFIKSGYTEITFEQFKKYVMELTNIKIKEIIGYKLTKPEYESAAAKICGYSSKLYTLVNKKGNFLPNSSDYLKIKEAGVLDIWFEPIYKEEEFKVGDYVYVEFAEFGAKGAEEQFGQITDEYSQNGLADSYPNGIKVKTLKGKVWTIGKDYTTVKLKKSSPEEVKTYENNLLIEEAKRRYPIGCKVKLFNSNIGGKYKNEVRFSSFEFLGNQLYIDGNLLIYENGKWAEILPSYPQIMINGYKAEFFDDYVKFGCQKFTKEFVINLNKCLQNNDLKMDYKSEIQEIAEYYLTK